MTRSDTFRFLAYGLSISLAALTALGCADQPPSASADLDAALPIPDSMAPAGDMAIKPDAAPIPDMDPPDEGCIPSDPPDEEVCDGRDNDCDGTIDEALQRRCYDGPAGTQGRGACTDGVQNCVDGNWDACAEQVIPAAETCNGIDEDCDGVTDERITQSCDEAPNEGTGECAAALQACEDGEWGECGEPTGPVEEVCDGRDNDCDGTSDEGFPDSDGDGFADCIDGDTDGDGLEAEDDNCPIDANPDQADLDEDGIGDVCDPDADGDGFEAMDDCGPLDADTYPDADETCDAVDNDCDGSVDEALSRACFDGPDDAIGLGPCVAGTQTCEAGAWTLCVGQVIPGDELCNAVDDDCDGTSDEGLDPGWPDADEDGFGDASQAPVCPRTPELVERGGDCNDDDPQVNPGNLTDPPDDAFIDANCDGIDGVLASTIFVAEAADPAVANGTMEAPYPSITAGIAAAARSDYSAVAIAAGTYAESVVLFDGISLVGGYDPEAGWTRGDDRRAVIRNEIADGVFLATVQADGVDAPTLLTDLIIETGDQANANGSTYALHATDAPGLLIRRSVLQAGRAGDGAPGNPGAAGADGQNGARGADCGGAVGAGGESPCGQPGFAGGAGSDVGERGRPGEPDGCGGRGGDSGDWASGDDGNRGCQGADGPLGANGDGFSNSAVRDDVWTTGAGAPGTVGGPGLGGGGGGGGGGGAVIPSPGGAGGGGGGGACGGEGGRGGAHGGGSFALFAVRSAGMRLELCELRSAPGGAGGPGGSGGPGGRGGDGGGGGEGARAFSCGGVAGPGDGGSGGRGGSGGQGGHGQAGNGGPSIAAFCIGGAIELADTLLSAAEPGSAGAGPGRPGEPGSSAPESGCLP